MSSMTRVMRYSSMILTCAFLACVCGCDEGLDLSEATDYFDTHEANTSLHQDLSTSSLTIILADETVATAGLTYDGQCVGLTAAGGTPPYTWDVHDIELGTIVESDGPNAVYQRNQAGDNVVILTDGAGNSAYVTIMQPLATL